MDEFFIKFKAVLVKKSVLSLFAAGLFVLIFIVILPSFLTAPIQNTTATPTPPSTSLPKDSDIDISPVEDFASYFDEDKDEPIEGFQNKELLPDGSTKYVFTSSKVGRSEITIMDDKNQTVFQSVVIPSSSPLLLKGFLDQFGNPKWIFKGSIFYGSVAQVYIYPDLGFALISDSETGGILEQHIFTPMKIEEYIKKYGEDIPSYP